MSAKGMTATVIATFLAKAVADDEAGEGCDLSAGVFGPAVSALIREIAEQMTAPQKPVDMILHCPACLEQHIDEPFKPGDSYTEHCPEKDLATAWTNPPHRSHLCKHCGFIWRPADVATNGVAAIKTKGKDDMVLFDGPAHELRMARLTKDLANPPKLEWEGDRP